MIFNCTSFHIFNTKFYSIICHCLRMLHIAITIFFYESCINAIMNVKSSQSFLEYYTVIDELTRSYEMLHVHSY
jgi:hypothetical protein